MKHPVARAAFAIVGLSLVLVVTLALAGLPILSSIKFILDGGFGNAVGLSRTAIKATPLLLTGLGMVVAWRAGMYNIGGEGQFMFGGLFGGLVAKLFIHSSIAPPIETISILVASIIGGALWASVAAWLYVKRGVQVVISTILLNFIALQLLGWAVHGPLQEAKQQLPQTDQLPDAVMLWRPNHQLDFHGGVLIALVIAPIIYVVLYKTVFGFRLRLVGANPRAARANRIDAHKIQFQSLALSGALCGLAGGIEYVGMIGILGITFSQGWGFMAIPVALIGGLHPLGTIVSALFFGALFAGTENLARFTPGGPTLLYVIQAIAVLGLVAYRIYNERTVPQGEPA